MSSPTSQPDDRAARQWPGQAGHASALLAFGLPLLALVLGGAADSLVHGRRVDLLSLPFWGLVAWNLGVCGAAVAGGWRARRAGPAGAAGMAPTPGQRARLIVVLHAAAAAFALGVVASAYLRALVVDLRAGWESTLLSPAAAQALLGVLLAPAQAVIGGPLPDLAPLRLAAGAAASVDAAPWLHRLALTLLLLVVLPRTLLALHVAWRARRRGPESADGPATAQARPGPPLAVAIWPCPLDPDPARRGALQALLGAALGSGRPTPLRSLWLPALAPGDEDPPATAPPGTGLGVLLIDATATPEAEVHGRLVAALRSASPGLTIALAVDAEAFERRFSHLPQRQAERRRAWQALAGQQRVQSIWLAPPP